MVTRVIKEHLKRKKKLFKEKIMALKYKTGMLSKLPYEWSNNLSYCGKCKKYMRDYQMEYKIKTDEKYKGVYYKRTKRPCIYCYDSEHKNYVVGTYGRNRMEWMDYIAEAPKLTYVEFEEHLKILEEFDRLNEEEQSVKLFLEYSGYMKAKIHDPSTFHKEPHKVEFLKEV